MIFGNVVVMAEFEREMIAERMVAGMRAAKRRSRQVGRPRKLPRKLDHARQLIAEGNETQAGAAAVLGVGVATLIRVLKAVDDFGGSPARGKLQAALRAGKLGRHAGGSSP